jgi:hypothetical protein
MKKKLRSFCVGNILFLITFFLVNTGYNDSASSFSKLAFGMGLLVFVAGVTALYIRVSKFGDRKDVLLAVLIIMTLGNAPWRHTAGPDGDVPHYLVAAYSLYADKDLEVSSNFENSDHFRYYFKSTGGRKLLDSRMRKAPDGRQVFWPSLGVPIFYALTSFVPYSFLANLILANLLTLSLVLLWQCYHLSGWAAAIVLGCGPWAFFIAQSFPDIWAFCFIAISLWAYATRTYWVLLLVGLSGARKHFKVYYLDF